jgi:hypothetical protein
MSKQPEGRTKDSRKSAENNIEQPNPIDKQDPRDPVEVQSDKTGKAKASADVGEGDAAAIGAAGL